MCTLLKQSVQLIQLVFSMIRLLANVVKKVEKSYVDKLDARKHLDFNLLRISPEILIYLNRPVCRAHRGLPVGFLLLRYSV